MDNALRRFLFGFRSGHAGTTVEKSWNMGGRSRKIQTGGTGEIMRRMYFCEGVFAKKKWGKTTFLARRAIAESQFSSVSSVFVIDPPDSFRDVCDLKGWHRWTSYSDFIDGINSRDGYIPRINVFCFGPDRANIPEYNRVFRLATSIGNTCLIVDEVQLFAPKQGKANELLVKIAAMGRHLPNHEGTDCQTNLIVSSQTWNGVNLDIRNQLSTVICGQIAGSANHKMLTAEVHHDAERKLKALKTFEFCVLQPDEGIMPKLCPVSELF